MWQLMLSGIPQHTIHVTFAMSLVIEWCLPATIINSIGNWRFSLENCSYAKFTNAQYNCLLGWKDSTCQTNQRTNSDACSSRLCICESKPHTMPSTKTNDKFRDGIFNNAHSICLATSSLTNIIEAQYRRRFQWNKLHIRVTVSAANCVLLKSHPAQCN